MVPMPVVADRVHAGLDAPNEVVTEKTVRKMGEHIANAQSDPVIRSIAYRASQRPDCLRFLWQQVKQMVRFRHDDSLIRDLFGERDHYELLVSPPVLVRMKRPEGDCDDFTMLIDALALCAGYPVRIVTLACDRARLKEYSHVYGAALADGHWWPLDVSHGSFPGWEVPRRDMIRRTSWTLDGYIASDERFN